MKRNRPDGIEGEKGEIDQINRPLRSRRQDRKEDLRDRVSGSQKGWLRQPTIPQMSF